MPPTIVSPLSAARHQLAKQYPELFSLLRQHPVTIRHQQSPGFTLKIDHSSITVCHQTLSDLYRALGELLVMGTIPRRLLVRRRPLYTFRGLMIDQSRNGVMKPSYLKQLIPGLALLGLNYLTLYTEDTYPVEGHPLIGYKRGAYTMTELKDLARFARQFGITMFPCIQTLGHLEQVLQLPRYGHLQDDYSILSYQKPETYALIEDFITSAVKPYDTDLIHIGMDETWGLAKGRTFKANTKIDPRQVYLTHLRKVNAICKKNKLKPLMWGDIVIGMHNQAMNRSQTRQLPKNITMDFWNYYRTDPAFYAKTIRRYRAMGFEPLISPGLWNWNTLWADYHHAARTMAPFMQTGGRLGVKQVLMTMWGDDGQEAPFLSSAPGLVHFLELAYTGTADKARLNRAVRALFREDIASYLVPSDMEVRCRAKGFLYDDPLLGKYSLHAGQKRYGARFKTYSRQLRKIYNRSQGLNRLPFQFAFRLADCLAVKADLRNACALAYRRKDRAALRQCVRRALTVINRVNLLRQAHREAWMAERKIQGWEVLDNRYGGLLARLETFGSRVDRYLKGRLDRLEEFEEKDLKLYPKLERFHSTYRHVAQVPLSRW